MLFRDTTDLAAMAEALSRSSDYRVLRRLVPRKLSAPLPGQETKTAIHLDTETTGLDFAKNEIVELGMVKFDYSADGRVVGVRDTFSVFNSPRSRFRPRSRRSRASTMIWSPAAIRRCRRGCLRRRCRHVHRSQ
jgi:DNA polymerase III subunit epsilon